jgi:hypothetical protein
MVPQPRLSFIVDFAIHNEAPFVLQPMLKKGQELSAARRAAIDAYKLETLKAPSLQPIKQVELYKKFRPFVPLCHWGETFPRPSDEVLAMVKNETAEKRKQKQVPMATFDQNPSAFPKQD